ncbi:MAG: hypothetical protein NVS2B14_08010 [Chamaesiphon sp.]
MFIISPPSPVTLVALEPQAQNRVIEIPVPKAEQPSPQVLPTQRRVHTGNWIPPKPLFDPHIEGFPRGYGIHQKGDYVSPKAT